MIIMNKRNFAKRSLKESKVDFQSVIDKVLPKEYAKNKNAYRYALSCVTSLYNEDEYDSDSAKVYFLNCYISDLFPSWVDELGEEEIDAFANALYDGTMKWSDIDSSWFESKKSAKTMNEKISPKYVYNFKNDGDYMIAMFDDYNFEILAIPESKSLFSKDLPKFKIEKTYIYEQYNDDIWLFVGEVEELGWCFIAFDKYSNNSNVYAYQYGDNKNYAYIPFRSYILYLENKKVYRTHNVESKKSTRNSLKEYLVKGLDVDFVVDHLLSLEDPNNFDLINELSDLWELYKKSWNKFNKSLSDFWKVMKNIEKLDSFDKTCEEIIDAWYDDIEKIFYSDDNLENLKLNYGFKGNDVF